MIYIPRRSIQWVFVTRDAFSDDGDDVVSCLEGESGLEACYAGTAAGEDVRLWGFEILWIWRAGKMEVPYHYYVFLLKGLRRHVG